LLQNANPRRLAFSFVAEKSAYRISVDSRSCGRPG